MSSIVLVPWPETTWDAARRIVSRTPVFLSELGQAQASRWADSIAPLGLRAIYSSDEPASEETAQILADKCNAKHIKRTALAEVDAGLWAGLTYDELKRRDPKVFKKWYDDPTSVCPPQGEELATASARLSKVFAEEIRRKGDWTMAAVLGPFAFAVSRCLFEAMDLANARSMMHDGLLNYQVLSDKTLTLSPPSAIVIGENGGMTPISVAE